MNKAELIIKVAEQTGISRKDTDKVINSALEAIMDALKNDEKVSLVGFGSFAAKERPAREGRNPLTNEVIEIHSSKAASFKAGKTMKETLNNRISR